jgi:hypothetical protein
VRGLWNRYGLSEADYNALYEAQGGRCAICEDPVANLLDHEGDGRTATALDHDHTTGAVRGILCPNCNTGLGGFRDDPERLRAAMAYLETSRMMTEMGT